MIPKGKGFFFSFSFPLGIIVNVGTTKNLIKNFFSLFHGVPCVIFLLLVGPIMSLETDWKKAGATTVGSPWTPFSCHTCFIIVVCRMCLVGVNMSVHSRCSWVLIDSWIRVMVSKLLPQDVLRVFHVPLDIVQPSLGCDRVFMCDNWRTFDNLFPLQAFLVYVNPA